MSKKIDAIYAHKMVLKTIIDNTWTGRAPNCELCNLYNRDCLLCTQGNINSYLLYGCCLMKTYIDKCSLREARIEYQESH